MSPLGMRFLFVAAFLSGPVLAADRLLKFDSSPIVETRTLDEIHQAAVKEGGVVTCWHGGDNAGQMDFLKEAFEAKFPDMTLNLTVDLSKYHDSRIDQQLAAKHVYVDSVVLQTVHDFPRWAQQDALLNYAPLWFDKIYPGFKDSISASWYGLEIISWRNIWSTTKLPNATFDTFEDFLKPEYNSTLVLMYPNDDDAVLFAFDIIMQKYGLMWFDRLLAQKPRWVRGAATLVTLIQQQDSDCAATFTSGVGFQAIEGIKSSFPTDAMFVSWAQTGGILKDASHPEGAKLLHSFMLSAEYQALVGWSVREDVPPPAGVPDIMHMPSTNPTAFARWMANRENVERLRFWFEDRLGTVQGKSPLVDEL